MPCYETATTAYITEHKLRKTKISYCECTFKFARAPRRVYVHTHIIVNNTRVRFENESCFKARADRDMQLVEPFVIVGNSYFSFRPVERAASLGK